MTMRRLILLGATMLGGIVAIVVVLYVMAPVGDLRGVVVYQPVGASAPRQAGLGAANVPLAEVPDAFLMALLYNEDKKFPDHRGFDLEELGISIREWVAGRRRLRGASTITQQLARTVFLVPERTLRRKVVEAIYTAKLERRFSKNEILSLYVNNVEWGSDVYGIAAAADHYFHKHPRDLTRDESVFLVAILPNPSRRAVGLETGHLPRRTRSRMRLLTLVVDRATTTDRSLLFAAVRKLKASGDSPSPAS